MSKFKLKLVVSTFALGISVSTLAYGADVVFDPANFAKNTITAAQQVQQTAKQAAILSEEVKQYQKMVQNLKQISPSVIQQGVTRGYIPPGNYSTSDQVYQASQGVYGTYQDVNRTMTGMDSTYQGMDLLMKDLDRTSIKSKVAADRILNYDFKRAQKGIEQDKNYYKNLQSLNGQLATHQKRADYLAGELPKQSGTVGMMQLVGTQNVLLQDQMSHLIQVSSMSTEKAVQSSLDQQEKAEREARDRAEAKETEKNTAKYFTNKK